MKKKKGQYGYIKYKKTSNLLITIAEFSVVIILLLVGYFTTGSNKNVFTVIAILGCLPAAKALVSFIVMIPYKSLPKEVKEEIKEKSQHVGLIYDLILTDKDKIMPVDAIAISGSTVCGYATNPKTDLERVTKDIKEVISNNGISGVTVKVFHEFKPFMTRVEGLSNIKAVDKSDTRELENIIRKAILIIAM